MSKKKKKNTIINLESKEKGDLLHEQKDDEDKEGQKDISGVSA